MKSKVFSLFLALLYISAVTAAEVGARLMPAAFQGNVFHIAADLRKPLWCSLLRTEKKVIHVKYIAVINLCQFRSQGGLAGGAFAINGHDHKILFSQ